MTCEIVADKISFEVEYIANDGQGFMILALDDELEVWHVRVSGNEQDLADVLSYNCMCLIDDAVMEHHIRNRDVKEAKE